MRNRRDVNNSRTPATAECQHSRNSKRENQPQKGRQQQIGHHSNSGNSRKRRDVNISRTPTSAGLQQQHKRRQQHECLTQQGYPSQQEDKQQQVLQDCRTSETAGSTTAANTTGASWTATAAGMLATTELRLSLR
jgi:hypothetical protein